MHLKVSWKQIQFAKIWQERGSSCEKNNFETSLQSYCK